MRGTRYGWGMGWGGHPHPHAAPHRVSPPLQLTFVDFLMFDVLEQNSIFEPKCLEPYKNLKDFMDRFGVSTGGPRVGTPEVMARGGNGSPALPLLLQALEKVAAYMKSSRFQKMPINNKMAKWGNKKE